MDLTTNEQQMDLTTNEQEIANMIMGQISSVHESLTNDTLAQISKDTTITENMIEIASSVHEHNLDLYLSDSTGFIDLNLTPESIVESIVEVDNKIYVINESTQDLEFVSTIITENSETGNENVGDTENDTETDYNEPITESNIDDEIQNIIANLKL